MMETNPKKTDAGLRRYLFCPKANYVHTAKKRALMNWAHGERAFGVGRENAAHDPKPRLSRRGPDSQIEGDQIPLVCHKKQKDVEPADFGVPQ